MDDHTSGGQRAAEAAATAEQLAEWERRLRTRVGELERELWNLRSAALTHSAAAEHIALAARAAADLLARGAHAYDNQVRREGTPTLAGDVRGEGVTHTLDRELRWAHSYDHGAVLLGVTETPALITPDRSDAPPFAAELAVDQPPHERPDPPRP